MARPAVVYTLFSIAWALAIHVKEAEPLNLWALLTRFDRFAGAVAAFTAVIGVLVKMMGMMLDMQGEMRGPFDEQGRRIDTLFSQFNALVLQLVGIGKLEGSGL